MWIYLLVLFVIALAVAPLVQALPSKRQRAIARLREYAAVRGLFVEFRTLPTPATSEQGSGRVIYYGKRLPASLPAPVTATWLSTPEGWRCLQGRRPPPVAIAEMPVEVLAAGIDTASCGVYWTEAGGEAELEAIRQALECWSSSLADS